MMALEPVESPERFNSWLVSVSTGGLEYPGEIASIDYALDHGAQILNCSFDSYWDSLEYFALERARNKGVIVVCATGNDAYDNDDSFAM